MSDYGRLAEETSRPKQARDLTAAWDRLIPLADATPAQLERVERFAADKGVSVDALRALDTRLALRGRGPDLFLAWGVRARPGGPVTAMKYGTSRLASARPSPAASIRPLLASFDR